MYDEINGSLEERGLSEVTLEEVIELTGSVPMIDGSTLSPDSLDKPEMDALASSATFETVYSTYVTGGRSYDVMRVYATPNGNTGTLYQTGILQSQTLLPLPQTQWHLSKSGFLLLPDLQATQLV